MEDYMHYITVRQKCIIGQKLKKIERKLEKNTMVVYEIVIKQMEVGYKF